MPPLLSHKGVYALFESLATWFTEWLADSKAEFILNFIDDNR